jgi:hypothetical protein
MSQDFLHSAYHWGNAILNMPTENGNKPKQGDQNIESEPGLSLVICLTDGM